MTAVLWAALAALVLALGVDVHYRHRARADADTLRVRVANFEHELADYDLLRAKLDDHAKANTEWVALDETMRDALNHAQADAAAWQARYEADMLDPAKNPLLLDTIRHLRMVVMSPTAAKAVHQLHNWPTGSWAAVPAPVAVEVESKLTHAQARRQRHREHRAAGTAA